MARNSEFLDFIRRLEVAVGTARNQVKDLKRTKDLQRQEVIARNLSTMLITASQDARKLHEALERGEWL